VISLPYKPQNHRTQHREHKEKQEKIKHWGDEGKVFSVPLCVLCVKAFSFFLKLAYRFGKGFRGRTCSAFAVMYTNDATTTAICFKSASWMRS
jgi:hypothetical protein